MGNIFIVFILWTLLEKKWMRNLHIWEFRLELIDEATSVILLRLNWLQCDVTFLTEKIQASNNEKRSNYYIEDLRRWPTMKINSTEKNFLWRISFELYFFDIGFPKQNILLRFFQALKRMHVEGG